MAGAKHRGRPDGQLLRRYIQSSIFRTMKSIRFLGNSLESLREFPDDARQDAGYQLDQIQRGMQPTDFKPMPSVGKGVEEPRVRDESGAFRVIYIARLPQAVFVLHAFRKKTRTTARKDIEIARERHADLMRDRR
jgi:phage-related protein